MKLFYASLSPFARKVRIVARELDLMEQIEEIAVNPFQDDPRLLAVNPAGLIPALLLDNGSSLIDSTLICHYLGAAAPERTLIPQSGPARWRELNHHAIANAILDFSVAAVYERRRTDTPVSQTFLKRKFAKIERCIAKLPNPPDTNTNAPTLSTITTSCALSHLDFRHPNLAWRTMRPDLEAWHATIETRAAFQDTKPIEPLI